jgi:hypothetical protein
LFGNAHQARQLADAARTFSKGGLCSRDTGDGLWESSVLFLIAPKLMFVSGDAGKFPPRQINHLRMELKKGYWATHVP